MGCLIILVNARLEEIQFTTEEQKAFFLAEFERVYHIKPNPLPGWNGAVLFRSFPVSADVLSGSRALCCINLDTCRKIYATCAGLRAPFS